MHRIAGAAVAAAIAAVIAAVIGVFADVGALATEIVSPFWTKPVARTNRTATGQPIAVAAAPEVIVSLTTIAVHGKLPVHKHPHQRYVYVLEGTLIVARVVCPPDDPASRVSTARPCTEFAVHTYKAGDFIAEMRDTWHTGRNGGEMWVKLLVIDQVPAGTRTNTVLRE
jgi:quercetin dioxygenase-like cupin family protein